MVVPGNHVGRRRGPGLTIARYSDLADAPVIVTGGGSGIGAALVEGFLTQGARVGIIDIIDTSEFADRLEQTTGTRPAARICDVSNAAALTASINDLAESMGGLRVLVNNAADDMRHVAEEVTDAIWRDSMAVNLDAYFTGCRTAAGLMRDGGAIINFSSITVQIGAAEMIPYVTANAGIVGMTRGLAREWGHRGIRVNAIAPGWVLTEKQLEKWATPESLKHFRTRQCLDRMLEPQDMVGPVLFLASDASGAVTGQTLIADAGVVHGG